jgi:catechol 2,3-dioxygenase-like lactoylglutathione lyase family enzyme
MKAAGSIGVPPGAPSVPVGGARRLARAYDIAVVSAKPKSLENRFYYIFTFFSKNNYCLLSRSVFRLGCARFGRPSATAGMGGHAMANGETGARAIKPRMHHVNLKTTRLDAMIDWYRIAVGADLIFKYPYGAWLSNDLANHRIALLAFPQFRDDPEKELRTGMHHMAYEFGGFAEFMEHYAHMKALGHAPFLCFDHGMTTSFYYFDPDHNALELQVDNFGDWEQSKNFMRHAEAFHNNPLGVFIDPERIYAAYKAGLSFEEIHARAMNSEYLPDPLPRIPLPEPI